MSAKALNDVQAESIAALDEDVVTAIVKLASLGLRSSDISGYASDLAAGKDRGPPSPNTSPRPVKIVAWSFVKDRGQYHGTYGLSAARAGELTELLLSDPDAAATTISTIVSEKLRRNGSQKPVHVSLAAIPRASGKDGTPPPSNDGGLRLIRSEIRANSGVYGSYKFVPQATGKLGAHSFRVSLGAGLYVYAQSKQLAVAAARVCRIKGRKDELVQHLVAQQTGDSSPKFGADISEKISFDGRLGPNDVPPPVPGTRAKTVAPGEGEGS